MKEDPPADLHDADDFFRRGDEGDFAEDESRPAGRPALSETEMLVEEESDSPDPALVELHLKRRARYTRWVSVLMGALSLGCVVLFAAHWLGSGAGSAEAAARPSRSSRSQDDQPVQSRTKLAKDIHGLRRTGRTGDGSLKQAARAAPAKQEEPPESAHPGSSTRSAPPAVAPSPAQTSTRTHAPDRKPAVARRPVQAPRSPRGLPQPDPAPRRAAVRRSAAAAARPTVVGRSARGGAVRRATQTPPENPQVPAVVVSRSETKGWSPDYQPPTAQFAD